MIFYGMTGLRGMLWGGVVLELIFPGMKFHYLLYKNGPDK